MKKIIQWKLKILAKIILAKYKPKIVGITGSVGKTSAREAVYAVLSSKFNVRRSAENYNNEIGVPLTIIGDDLVAEYSLLNWLKVFIRAWRLILIKDKNYPKILVLEMGVDRPGDMKYLNNIVKCKVGIVTMVGPVHIEFFGSLSKIKKEKSELIRSLGSAGWAILNYDNPESRSIKEISRSRVLTYGLNEKAMVRALELKYNFANTKELKKHKDLKKIFGLNFKLAYSGSFVPIFLKGVIGHNAVYAALAGASAGIAFGLNLVDISKSLNKFCTPPGRMNLLLGVKHSLLIDDTYNSSPQAVKSSLEILAKIPISESNRRFAVLGDMLELGRESVREHNKIGKYCAKLKIDKLITVGERSRDIGRGARDSGLVYDNIFHFSDSKTAGKFLQDRLRSGDVVLIKGSRGMKMEKIVKEVMADPLYASKFLVGQK